MAAQPVITAPPEMANKTMAQALDDSVNWTSDLRQEIQRMITKSDHQSVCSGEPVRDTQSTDLENEPVRDKQPTDSENEPVRDTPSTNSENEPVIMTNYPNIDKQYSPPLSCARELDYTIPVPDYDNNNWMR